MARKSKLKSKENQRYNKQVKDSLERQQQRIKAERPSTKAGTTRTFSQTTTPEVNPNQGSAKPEPTLERTGKNSPKNPAPAPENAGAKKTTTGKPNTAQKPHVNARNPGPGRFGNKPVSTKPPVERPRVGKVKGTLGTIGAIATAEEAFGVAAGYTDQQDAFDTYGNLQPDSTRTNFDPLGRAVDDVAGFVTAGRAEPNLLDRTGSKIKQFITGDPAAKFSTSEDTFQQDAMLTRAAAMELGEDVGLGDVTPEQLEGVRRRADVMKQAITDGTFDPATLTPEDAELARNMGVKLDQIPTPQSTRTGLPPQQDVLTGEPEVAETGSGVSETESTFDPANASPEVLSLVEQIKNAPNNGRASQLEMQLTAHLNNTYGGGTYQNAGVVNDLIYGEQNAEPEPTIVDPETGEVPAGTDPSLERQEPKVFKKVGEDGTVEFSQSPGEGFEEVDLGGQNTNLKGGFAASQDNIQQFPGTSAFVEGISRDVRARKVDFQRQQKRARGNQNRLYDQARTNVLSSNPHLRRLLKKGNKNEQGAASAALNKYTLQAMQIQQQGRDAFKAEDFDTTAQVLEADKNDILAAGVDADLARTDTYAERNRIDAAGNIIDAIGTGRDLDQQALSAADKLDEQFFNENYQEDEEGQYGPDRASAWNTHQQLKPDNYGLLSRADQQKVRQRSAFISDVQDVIREQGIAVNPQMLSDFTTMNEMILGNKVKGITVSGSRGVINTLKNLGEATANAFSSSDLKKNFVKIGNKNYTLQQYLNFGKGQGFNEAGVMDLARQQATGRSRARQ